MQLGGLRVQTVAWALRHLAPRAQGAQALAPAPPMGLGFKCDECNSARPLAWGTYFCILLDSGARANFIPNVASSPESAFPGPAEATLRCTYPMSLGTPDPGSLQGQSQSLSALSTGGQRPESPCYCRHPELHVPPWLLPGQLSDLLSPWAGEAHLVLVMSF